MQLKLVFLIFLLSQSCQTRENKVINEVTTNSTQPIKPEVKLDTLLNSKEYLILGKELANVKVIQEGQGENFPTFDTLATYRNDLIIGENINEKGLKIFRKYHPKSTFEDYKVEVYKGELAAPDFSTDPDAKRFITRITNECKNGINFAGHYTLVIWGCGSPCQNGVVVDRKTGAILGNYGTSLGSKFRKDSRMIIRNVGAIDTISNLVKVCSYCEVDHAIWTGKEFKEIE